MTLWIIISAIRAHQKYMFPNMKKVLFLRVVLEENKQGSDSTLT